MHKFRYFDPKQIDGNVYACFSENFPINKNWRDYATLYYGHGGINAIIRDNILSKKLKEYDIVSIKEFDEAIIIYHIFSHIYAHTVVEILPDIIKFVEYRNEHLDRNIPIIAPRLLSFNIDEIVLKYFRDNNVIMKNGDETFLIKNRSWMNLDQHPTLSYDSKELLINKLYYDYYNRPAIFNYKKIYVDRTPKNCLNQDRFLTNRDELFNLIKPKGFNVIDCSYLSRLEQINVFKYASEILTIHGSAETNIIYCQPRTKIYECNIRESWNYFKDIADRYNLDHKMMILPSGFGENITFNIEKLNDFINS